MIQKASGVLYRATRQQAYFKDVRILIPESWDNVQANISTWETFSVRFCCNQIFCSVYRIINLNFLKIYRKPTFKSPFPVPLLKTSLIQFSREDAVSRESKHKLRDHNLLFTDYIMVVFCSLSDIYTSRLIIF